MTCQSSRPHWLFADVQSSPVLSPEPAPSLLRLSLFLRVFDSPPPRIQARRIFEGQCSQPIIRCIPVSFFCLSHLQVSPARTSTAHIPRLISHRRFRHVSCQCITSTIPVLFAASICLGSFFKVIIIAQGCAVLSQSQSKTIEASQEGRFFL